VLIQQFKGNNPVITTSMSKICN